jgi:hypothetical protein
VLGGVGGEARDASGLVVVFEKDGGPAVGGGADELLSAGDGALELWEDPVARGGLEFVGSLADIDDVLIYCVSYCS